MTARYDLAEHGLPGWHASSASGSSSTSGYGHDLARVFDDLADGAYVIDKAALFDSETFVADVMQSPMHGDPTRNGDYVGALREAPYMTAVVAAYGLGGSTAAQVIHETSGAPGFGPMDYAPAEYLADYWRQRGARIGRYVNGAVSWEDEDR